MITLETCSIMGDLLIKVNIPAIDILKLKINEDPILQSNIKIFPETIFLSPAYRSIVLELLRSYIPSIKYEDIAEEIISRKETVPFDLWNNLAELDKSDLINKYNEANVISNYYKHKYQVTIIYMGTTDYYSYLEFNIPISNIISYSFSNNIHIFQLRRDNYNHPCTIEIVDTYIKDEDRDLLSRFLEVFQQSQCA